MQQTISVVLIAVCTAQLFAWAKIPLAWMLGPLAAGMGWLQVRKQDFYWPTRWRNWSLLPIGYGMGKYVTAHTLKQIIVQLPGMMVATALMLLACYYLARLTATGAGLSASSSILGSTPGGLSQMAVLGEEFEDTDLAAITFMQTARLLGVVCIVPVLVVHGLASDRAPVAAAALATAAAPLGVDGWLAVSLVVVAGAWLAVKLRWPTPYMMGPVFAIALASLVHGPLPSLPIAVMNGAQLVMGLYLAKRFRASEGSAANWRPLFFFTAIGVLLMIIVSLALAWGLSSVYHFSLTTAFLAMAPGGIAEMGLTGIALGEDVSIIFAYQLFRLLFVLGVLPMLLRKLLYRSSLV